MVCRDCENGLGPDNSAYRLFAGHGGVGCYYNNCFQAGRCARNATSVRFKTGQHVASRKKTTTGCDGCWREIKKGEMAWHYKKCWDKDLCQKC